MTDTPDHEPPEKPRPPQEMRLRSTRPPVTRLSRKVLLGLSSAAAILRTPLIFKSDRKRL
jgi:type IV secretion system protein VirB10